MLAMVSSPSLQSFDRSTACRLHPHAGETLAPGRALIRSRSSPKCHHHPATHCLGSAEGSPFYIPSGTQTFKPSAARLHPAHPSLFLSYFPPPHPRSQAAQFQAWSSRFSQYFHLAHDLFSMKVRFISSDMHSSVQLCESGPLYTFAPPLQARHRAITSPTKFLCT